MEKSVKTRGCNNQSKCAASKGPFVNKRIFVFKRQCEKIIYQFLLGILKASSAPCYIGYSHGRVTFLHFDFSHHTYAYMVWQCFKRLSGYPEGQCYRAFFHPRLQRRVFEFSLTLWCAHHTFRALAIYRPAARHFYRVSQTFHPPPPPPPTAPLTTNGGTTRFYTC